MRGRSVRRSGAVLAVLALAAAGLASGSALGAGPGGTPADVSVAQIRGRVVTDQGQPIDGCFLNAASATGDPDVGGSASTSGGEFTLWLPVGDYTLRGTCWAAQPGPRDIRTEVALPTGGADLGDVVAPVRTAVSGTVTAGGVPVAGAWISFEDSPGYTGGSFVTDAAGAFSGTVPPGTYTVRAQPPAGVEHAATTLPAQVVIGSTPVVIPEIVLDPGGSVSGHVTSGGLPVAGVSVIGRQTDGADPVWTVQTDAQGAWRLSGLRPGTYELEPYSDTHVGPRSTAVTIVGAQAVTGVDIEMSPIAAAVTVQASTTDGGRLTPDSSAVAVDPAGTEVSWGLPGGSGSTFTLDRLAVGGSYAIGVNRQSGQSLYTGRYFDGDGVLGSATQSGATTVTASSSARAIGSVRLDRCATVSGRVVGMSGWADPAPFDLGIVDVAVYNDDDPDAVTRSATVASDGTFHVTGLLPGEYYAALRVNRSYQTSASNAWFGAEEIFGGVDPAVDEPNIVVAADCGEVEGINFGVTQVVAQPDQVVPVTPVRLTDAGAVPAFGQARCTSVVGAGAPTGASGVLVNVASVSPVSEGNVLVFPDDGSGHPTPPPGVSVNFEPGREVANAAFVKVGSNGKICVYSQAFAPSRVVVDVTGFTMPDSGVVLQSSTRLLDTRPGGDHVGELAGALAQNTVYEITVGGRAGVPADAKAVVLNVAAVSPAGSGHLRVYPANGGGPAPDIATVNYAPGRTKSNATVVPLAGGKIGLYSNTFTSTPVDVVLDVTGYVAADGQTYETVDPERVLDTRSGAPGALRVIPTLAANQVYSLDVRGTDVVPDDATGVVLNVTAIGPTTVGNLRVYPDSDGTGTTPPPDASQINYIPGRDIPNLVVVGVPADGRVNFYSNQFSGGRVDLAVDVVGYTTG